MKHYKKIKKEVHEIESITCSICGITYRKDSDDLKFQEIITIEHICGYGSSIGDGYKIDLDICEECLKKYILSKVTNRYEV